MTSVRVPIENPYPTKDCFGCGPQSDCGLHLEFYWDADAHELSADFLPERRFVGQGDILHGAIQAGLLDESMGWTIHAELDALAVTTNLNVDYVRPVYIRGTEVRVTCRMLEHTGSRVTLSARIVDSDGVLCTSAVGTFHVVRPEKYDELVHSG